MTDQAAMREENAAAGIFDEYLTERLQGRQPVGMEFIARCPAAKKVQLEEAIQGAEVFLQEYHLSYVRPSIVEKNAIRH